MQGHIWLKQALGFRLKDNPKALLQWLVIVLLVYLEHTGIDIV